MGRPAAGQRAGTGKVCPHGLCHTGITTPLERSNGNISKVARYSRHASIETVDVTTTTAATWPAKSLSWSPAISRPPRSNSAALACPVRRPLGILEAPYQKTAYCRARSPTLL